MTDDNNETTALTTPAAIGAWVFLSRMHQIALELNTGMKHSSGVPILRAMHREGLIDVELRGTKANKRAVLTLMVETYRENVPGWEPPASVTRALSGEGK